MVYRFLILSEEVQDFAREIEISSEATFFDLHKIILKSCNYEDNQITGFYLCDEDWKETTEVTMEDMGKTNPDEDCYVMRDTKLEDLLEEEKQHLAYVFDPINERVLLMDLMEISSGDLKKPKCIRSIGDAPVQCKDPDFDLSFLNEKGNPAEDLDESFYGSEGFADEDLDLEGLNISDDGGF
jgi:hypothetical protein